jgi:hypothetical protein
VLGEERVWATGRRDERGIPRDAGGGKRVERGDRAGGGRCAHLRSVADGDGAVLGGEQIFAKLTGAMGRLPTGTVQRVLSLVSQALLRWAPRRCRAWWS